MNNDVLKNKQSILFKTAKIDSFTLLIPLEFVGITSSTFTQKYEKLYPVTGEVEDEKGFYENYIKTECLNTGTFLKYKKVDRLFNSAQKLPFIQIIITSKQLLSNYFDGINYANIRFIYDRIIADRIIDLTIDAFLNSYISDIDICKDYQVNGIAGFKELKENMLFTSLVEKRNVISTKNANSKEMFGLMYNDRSKGTNALPYCKLYYKTSELYKDKSNGVNKPKFKDFNLNHIQHIIDAGIARVEVTIKASKHKAHLGIENVKTLKDLLNVSQPGLENIFISILGEYYNQKQPIDKALKSKDGMAPKDLMLSNAIEFILQNHKGITTPMMVRLMQNGCFDKDKKSTVKRYTLEIIDASNNKKIIEKNNLKALNSIEILKDLKIFE